MPKWFSPFSFKKRKKGQKKNNFHTATCTNRGSILGLGRQLGPQTAGPRAGGTWGLPGVPLPSRRYGGQEGSPTDSPGPQPPREPQTQKTQTPRGRRLWL